MTDWFTDELFDVASPRINAVVFPVSRLVVDPERFELDTQESMSQVGMGVIYVKTSDGKVLRLAPTAEERSRLLNQFYRPHHQELTEKVDQSLTRHGRALVIDCHSFPGRPLQYEFDQSMNRPDICLGTDNYHSPSGLLSVARELFHDLGFSVSVDRPFSGALVPEKHYSKDQRVAALMIEVNRSLYMNELTGEKLSNFSDIHERVSSAVQGLVNYFEGECIDK